MTKVGDKCSAKDYYNYFTYDSSLMCLMFMELFIKNIQWNSRTHKAKQNKQI